MRWLWVKEKLFKGGRGVAVLVLVEYFTPPLCKFIAVTWNPVVELSQVVMHNGLLCFQLKAELSDLINVEAAFESSPTFPSTRLVLHVLTEQCHSLFSVQWLFVMRRNVQHELNPAIFLAWLLEHILRSKNKSCLCPVDVDNPSLFPKGTEKISPQPSDESRSCDNPFL